MQVIQNLLTYVIKQKQTTSVQVFTDNQEALPILKDLNKYFLYQIMQATTLQFDTLRTQGKIIFFYYLHRYKREQRLEIAVKKATKWRKAK